MRRKRGVLYGFLILALGLAAVLCRTAVDPADFTGRWYASADQSVYLFQEGIVYCAKHPVMLSEEDAISGAYAFGRDSICLFARGVPGLERERVLYLVRREDSSFLCENRDGTGPVYFIRYDQ